MTMAPVLLGIIITAYMQFMLSGCEALCLGVDSCTCEVGQVALGIVINCRHQQLDSIPVFQNHEPTQLYYELTLENNQIRRIEERAFATVRMKRLVLRGNKIGYISDKAFDGLEMDLVQLILELSSEADFPTAGLAPLKGLQFLEVIGYSQHSSLPEVALFSLTNLQTLSLTAGSLQYLHETDFISQQSSLISLDLKMNQFTNVPIAAINQLKHLSVLYLNLNSISVLPANSFAGLAQLKALDLSRNSLSIVDQNSFAGLDICLQNLTMQMCHLRDNDLSSMRSLRQLMRLDISDNYITIIDDLLGNLKSLQDLKIARNRITSVSKSVYHVLSNSLQLLELSGNPISEIASDAFTDLTELKELYLDGASGVQLNETSFKSQQKSLKILSLRYANLSLSQWTSINDLTGLQTLWMSSCNLGNTPDFTFRATNQLENLDLNSNCIASVTQRSLTGLENSLVRLYLGKNQLTTLHECTFYQFTKIDILQLQLNGNPLQCDCRMKWLHDRLQPYKTNPNTTYRVSTLRWTCDNMNGRLFNNLTDGDFENCKATTSTCEDLISTTKITTTTTALPVNDDIILTVGDVTSTSITILWSVNQNLAVELFILNYSSQYSDAASLQPFGPNVRNFTLTGLTPATTYVIILEVVAMNSTQNVQTTVSTQQNGQNSKLSIILGVTIGVGLPILIIIGFLALMVAKKSKQKGIVKVPPKLGDQTKRFIKPSEEQTVLSPGPPTAAATTTGRPAFATADDAIVQTIETMSDQAKYRLASLLRESMDSLNDIIGSPNYKSSTTNRFAEPFRDRHVYEEIPDSYYDEIPTDDSV